MEILGSIKLNICFRPDKKVDYFFAEDFQSTLI